MQNKQVQFKDWGIAQDYEEIWAEQEKLLADNLAIKSANRAKEKAGDTALEMTHNHLFFVEHPHVYTLGRSGHLENLLASQAFLDKIEATFVKTNRGGDITYHGPEQLVGYPVLDLENFKSDIHWYMRNLEEVFIVLAHSNVEETETPETNPEVFSVDGSF